MRYVGFVARQAKAAGHDVTALTTPEARRSAAFHQFLGPEFASKVFEWPSRNTLELPFPLPGTAQLRAFLWFRSAVSNLSRTQPIDAVFVPYLNYIDKAIALLGSPFGQLPWSGIVMRESFHHAPLGLRPKAEPFAAIREKLFWNLLSKSKPLPILTIDETLAEYIQPKSKDQGRLAYVPDPSDVLPAIDRSRACIELGLDPSRFYLLCYGHIDQRKGILELLQALRHAGEFHKLAVIIAGKCEQQTKNAITAHQASPGAPSILTIDRFIEPVMEQRLFSAADAVWVGYKEHFGSSGIVGQATAAGKPVIACKAGLIGFLTARHKFGICVDIQNSTAILHAISHLMTDRQSREEYGRAGHAFSCFRTPEVFSSRILELLEQHGQIYNAA